MQLLSQMTLNFKEIMAESSKEERDEWMYQIDANCIQIFCNGERFEGDVIVNATHRFIAYTKEAFGDEYEVVSFEDQLFDPYVLEDQLTLNFNYSFGFVFDDEDAFTHLLYALALADYNYKNGIAFQKPDLPTTPFEPEPSQFSEYATWDKALLPPQHFFDLSVTYMDHFFDSAYDGKASKLDFTTNDNFGFFAANCTASGSFCFHHGEFPIEEMTLNFFKVQGVYCDKASLTIYVALSPMTGTTSDYVLSSQGAIFQLNNAYDYYRLGTYFYFAIGR